MRTAPLEVLLLAVAGGLLGAWIVLRRLAFFAHAVGGATFPGLVVGRRHGISPDARGPRRRARVRRRSPPGRPRAGGRAGDGHGLLLVAALALGVILASDVFESGARVDRLLFGTLLGLDRGDLVPRPPEAVLAAGAAVAARPRLARVRLRPRGRAHPRAPVGRADALLLVLVAVAVVTALPAVGALLTTALFIVPAATASLLARSVRGAGARPRWRSPPPKASSASTWRSGSTPRRARRSRCSAPLVYARASRPLDGRSAGMSAPAVAVGAGLAAGYGGEPVLDDVTSRRAPGESVACSARTAAARRRSSARCSASSSRSRAGPSCAPAPPTWPRPIAPASTSRSPRSTWR